MSAQSNACQLPHPTPASLLGDSGDLLLPAGVALPLLPLHLAATGRCARAKPAQRTTMVGCSLCGCTCPLVEGGCSFVLLDGPAVTSRWLGPWIRWVTSLAVTRSWCCGDSLHAATGLSALGLRSSRLGEEGWQPSCPYSRAMRWPVYKLLARNCSPPLAALWWRVLPDLVGSRMWLTGAAVRQ